MTTTAMIFGMLPLFFGLGEGAEFRAPMARAVVGGLITSTLLTLIVVPVVYTILDDVSAWLFGRRRRKPQAAAAVRAVVACAVLFGAQPVRAQEAAKPATALRLTRRLRPWRLDPVRVAAAPATAAAAPQGPVKVLTLEEALAIAATQNRDIKKAIEYKNWVQGKYLEERASALPQGGFNRHADAPVRRQPEQAVRGLHAGADTEGGGTEHRRTSSAAARTIRSGTFSVTQVVFTWGQVGAAIRAAKLGFDLADDQLRPVPADRRCGT